MLSCLLDIMGMMVEAGAEIYRVEESARRICAAYGIEKVDVYATTTNIIVTVEPEAGFIKTHTKRILKISTDIEKIDKLNSLVRRMSEKEIPLSTVRDEMARIKQMKEYPSLVICLFYLLIAASFYFFFGGRDPVELLVASVIGFLVGVLSELLHVPGWFLEYFCKVEFCIQTAQEGILL